MLTSVLQHGSLLLPKMAAQRNIQILVRTQPDALRASTAW